MLLIGLEWTRGSFIPRSLSLYNDVPLKMAVGTWAFHACLFSSIFQLNGQFPKKEKYHAVKEDLPYIKCETCQKAVKYLYGKTQEMRGGGTKKVNL